ncbi:AzlC family ABC transporter permease [Cellulomonas sp. zg-ZUI222]|uniref:AzlC family ABC transporter permease n=1 Tax=Cellulomonas wangleii TaxID=2816956 RepID=A0ABX8D8E2_9CELL|nr:AzlC family ABC transporter permease [Cellulomonas sp. zg-ZUI22]MBO0921352.1 AzlC family ABC transporter permease [Cellulomonas wangleii]MBO0925768.1 AzlC family ABC transporter permease [Cellulomonas wangleii]QVI63710.1 AzlC family ABC transporter permease [Cellulomonas wangleii]
MRETGDVTTHDPASAARRQAVSVSVATGLYGISFGALSVAAGLSVPQTMALSLLMFSGGSQFAFIGVVGGGGAMGAAVASAALLGARNGLYGAQLTPLLDLPWSRRLPAAQLTIDESTAVATAQPTRAAARVGFWWTGVGVYVLWNLFSLLGALVGDRLGDPRAYGLDAAAAAAFLALVWPRLAGRAAQAVAAAAVVVALATTPLLPAGVPVLLAALVAVVVGLVTTRRPPAPGAGA